MKDKIIKKILKNRYLLYIFPIGTLVILFIISSLFSIQILKAHHSHHIEKYKEEFFLGKEAVLKNNIHAVVKYLVQNPQCKDRQKLIKKISEIRYKNDRYVFIFSYDKETNLLQPIVNPNMPKELMGIKIDPKQIKDNIKRDFMLDIVSSLQEEKDDGFFIYNFKEPFSQNISKKLSYVYHYKPYNWYIGTGIHINTLDQYMDRETHYLEEDLSSLIKKYFLISAILVLFLIVVIYLIIRYIQNKQHNLRQYENILQNIKNEISVYYWICSIEKNNFYCTEVSSNYLDHIQSVDDMLDNVVENDFEDVKLFFKEVLLKKQNQITEFRLYINGKINYFKCYCNFVFNDLTKKQEVMIVLVDVSTYKETELQVIENQVVSIQNKTDRDLLDFINMISHQWRHPISYINSKLIDLDIEPFDKKEFIHDIESTTDFLSNTIEDFVAIFSNQNDTDYIFLDECFENILKILQPKLVDIEVSKNILKEIEIVGNSTKLQQVLMIMIKNSIDAFKNVNYPDKKIWIRANKHLGYVSIQIFDNAQGADQNTIDKLFDLYYTTKHGKNKGLGLYMAKLLIERFFFGQVRIRNYKNGFKNTIFIPLEGLKDEA